MPPNTHKSSIILFFIIISVACNSVNHPSIEESFKQCLVSQPSVSLGHCFGVGAISKLRSLDSDQEFDLIDGVTLSRNQEYRETYNFADRDPGDFRTWIDSLSHVFSHRSLQWDMGFLYPGLFMRVAPSTSPGGQLEFMLDPQREILNKHSIKEFGTGRLLARQFLVPFLLGFKFNVATLIPILFGLLALLAKKAIILSKIALVISSAYGLGTLLLGNNGNRVPNQYQTGGFNPGFGGSSQFHHHNRFPEDEYPEVYYRGIVENNNVDQLRVHGKIQKLFTDEKTTHGRNFAWSEDEKVQKST
ncbi:uncharacterized protein LOC123015670 [Tribolium madens]|uniref:uncharacterized protein LOC123015670 n=1 Tax=Tribolium madens TaxID=41895 RepID=UPI001CF75398|nr:uncharacterized protein LOC123015670 [Tribolium madens]